MKYNEEYDLWMHSDQKEEVDIKILKDISEEYKPAFAAAKDKVVLDIGGNIGTASIEFAKVCKHLIVVEPEPTNFAILSKNLEQFDNVTLINAGVGETDGEMTLYVNKGKNGGTHTLLQIGRRDQIQVQIISFSKLLEQYKPEVLKFDAEGAEQFVRNTLIDIPDYIKHITIEYDICPGRMAKSGFARDASLQLYNAVKSQFAEHLKEKIPDPTEMMARMRNGFYIGER